MITFISLTDIVYLFCQDKNQDINVELSNIYNNSLINDGSLEDMLSKQGYSIMNQAEFIVLDKISANKSIIRMHSLEQKIIDTMVIKFNGCVCKPGYGIDHFYALVGLYDLDRSLQIDKFFVGWLSSYPRFVSKINHPIYDVLLVKCF